MLPFSLCVPPLVWDKLGYENHRRVRVFAGFFTVQVTHSPRVGSDEGDPSRPMIFENLATRPDPSREILNAS